MFANLAGYGSVEPGNIASLTFNGAGEDEGAVALFFSGVEGSFERFLIAADNSIFHAAEERVSGFGGLGRGSFQPGTDAGRNLVAELKFVEDSEGRRES